MGLDLPGIIQVGMIRLLVHEPSHHAVTLGAKEHDPVTGALVFEWWA